VDYWVLAKDHKGRKWSFSSYDRKWHRGWCHEYLTGPLDDIQDTVLDNPLPLGSYIAYCGIDDDPNGSLNIADLVVHDEVNWEVISQPPIYKYDDGTSENAVGLANNGQFCWIHRFDTILGAEDIVDVQVAFGTPLAPGHVTNGAPCTVYVWNDPNDDGDPSNAVLLASQSGTVQNADTDIFNVYSLGSPVTVSGMFYIGCMVDVTPSSDTPASIDLTTPYVTGNGYYAFTISPDLFDENNLSNNNLYENAIGGIPYYYLLRAGYQP
jgi:hypothetical protein